MSFKDILGLSYAIFIALHLVLVSYCDMWTCLMYTDFLPCMLYGWCDKLRMPWTPGRHRHSLGHCERTPPYTTTYPVLTLLPFPSFPFMTFIPSILPVRYNLPYWARCLLMSSLNSNTGAVSGWCSAPSPPPSSYQKWHHVHASFVKTDPLRSIVLLEASWRTKILGTILLPAL